MGLINQQFILGGAGGGGEGTPGGSNTQVQFNDSGSFGGDSALVWSKADNILTVPNIMAPSDGNLTLISAAEGDPDYKIILQGYDSSAWRDTLLVENVPAGKIAVKITPYGNLFIENVSGDNYEHGFIKWVSNVLKIGTQAGGTGTPRNISINAINGGGNSTVTIENDDATYVANLVVEGNISGATYGSNGTVTDAELLYINTLSSNAQDQINGKQTSDATLTALAGLTIADVSVIEGTGADAFNVVTSGGNNYFLGSNSGNTALEFKTPAATLSAIGGQASDATLTALAGLTIQDVSIIEGTGADAFNVVASGGANRVLGANSDNTALEFKSSLSVSEVNLPSSDADPATTAGQVRHDTSHESITGGVLKWFDGTNVRVLMDRLNDGTGSGNLKSKGYIILTHPHCVDGTGCVLQTTSTDVYYGQGKFTNDADKAANYLEYRLAVPEDIDLDIDLVVIGWKFRLGGADTGKHAYIISMDGVADSASYAGSLGDPINVFFDGDGSGADGDVETVSGITLTGWKAALTAGQLWVIRMARDGDDGTNDTSTVDSYSGPLVISYGKVQ